MDNFLWAIAAGAGALLLAGCLVGPRGRPPGPPPKPPEPPMPKPPKPPSPPTPPATPGGGRAFVDSLPEAPTMDRDQRILAAITEGFHRPIVWQPVTSTYKGVTATAWVTDDAIAVGTEEDFVRISVRHSTAQRIADVLNAMLTTSKIADLAWQQAQTRLEAYPQSHDLHMADTSRMREYHDVVEKARAGRRGLVRTTGKEFIVCNKLKFWPAYMVQYGMHDTHAPHTGPGGLKVWQTVDLSFPTKGAPKAGLPPHPITHTDYSSMTTLVHPTCQVDGVDRALADVLRDPALAPLFSHEGAMTVLRHPAVPEPGGIV